MPSRTLLISIAIPLILLLMPHCNVIADEGIEFFEKQVRPILVKRCYACHSGTERAGDLALDTAQGWRKGGAGGSVIVPGKPEDSRLLAAIRYEGLEMPPPDEGEPLTDQEIDAIEEWIELGAPDPRIESIAIGGMTIEAARSWWAFQPLPEVDLDLDSTQIDRLLELQFAPQDKPNPPADRRTWIRRATYDLTGLPPTMDEVDEFIEDDSPQAYSRVIDRLLASDQYGVRWGRHWLDVVRYADTAGENTDRPLPHAWRYRNWVMQAINRDIPLDEFARLQLAGDRIAPSLPPEQYADAIIATGYLAIARRFGHDIDKDIHLMHEDVIDNVGKNFLGLTLGCARCHDHKYDAISAQDYYALYGIFESTRFSFPGCEPKGQPRDLVPLLPPQQAAALDLAFQKQLADYQQRLEASQENAVNLEQLSKSNRTVLSEANVEEGAEVTLKFDAENESLTVFMKRGEVLQLTVLPNAGHGADTTKIQLEIDRNNGNEPQTWSVEDLISRYGKEGPMFRDREAAWCLLEVTSAPTFLNEHKVDLQGHAGLHAWSIGDTPSSVVNHSDHPVMAWTNLPANSIFIHPGPNRPVAIAWICPHDAEYRIQGRLEDGHPAPGLDGVSYKLEHIANSEFGDALLQQGERALQVTQPPQPPLIPVAYAVTEGDIGDAELQRRGDPELQGPQVDRRWLEVFGGHSLGSREASGRLELAEQIVQHPLFARVMANRIWQHHFGEGLVETPNDFGQRGAAPSHPELLDWLAAQLRAGGYRAKPIHRLIMSSKAYQRSSNITNSLDTDTTARSRFTCFPRRRLTAEELRDSLLVAGQNLDKSFGEGHPFPPESSWSFTQHAPFNAVYETNRRSAFLMVQRQRRHPFLALFDGADPNASTPRRQASIVPTQALYFLNDPFFHTQASLVAEQLRQLPETQRIDACFSKLFQRQPSDEERQIGRRFLDQYPGTEQERLSAYTRALLSTNEFLYLD